MERKPFEPVVCRAEYQPLLLDFLKRCLPESGRALDIGGRHSFYNDIDGSFDGFWCMFADDGDVIGCVGVRRLGDADCELKSLYLLEEYHGMGYGRCLLEKAVGFAREAGYARMYLDTLSTSHKAIRLYRRAGFNDVERYNRSERSDVFMMLEL